MECDVARRGNPVGRGVRCDLPGVVFPERQQLGTVGSDSLSVRYVGLVCGVDPLPLASYAASTLYHSMKHHSKWKERLRKWDHAAIYWHIAGSYSPLTLVALRTQGYWGWALFVFVWTCAIVGTIISFVRLKEHSNVETFCFIGMGLSVLVAFKPLMDSVSAAAVIWLIAEGVSYITGAVFYSFNKTKYMHSVFHFFVLAGSVCHIIAVWDVLMEYL